MRAPTANELLLAWERGLDQSPTRRALALLAAALPGTAPDKLAALPVGARDARLLRLRASLFGDAVAAVSQCPACGERLDVAFRVDDVCPAAVDAEDDEHCTMTHQLCAAGYDITYRVPTSTDVLALSVPHDGITPQHALLQRCVISVQHDGAATPVDALPDTIIAALSSGMSNADPRAQIDLGLTCPACGHVWHALLDIAAFLWSEIHAWAQRTLRDVHALARAYGWREADILAMSARRRQIYLDLARS